jgi:hypothetical protein
MRGLRPIPLRLLAHDAVVRFPDGTGAFEVPSGSRVDIDGRSLYVTACRRCEGMGGRVHHWELTVR